MRSEYGVESKEVRQQLLTAYQVALKRHSRLSATPNPRYSNRISVSAIQYGCQLYSCQSDYYDQTVRQLKSEDSDWVQSGCQHNFNTYFLNEIKSRNIVLYKSLLEDAFSFSFYSGEEKSSASVLYRGDGRDPNTIFQVGFKKQFEPAYKLTATYGITGANGVSTSRKKTVADCYNANSYSYQLKFEDKPFQRNLMAIDIDKTSVKRNKFSRGLNEVNFLSDIPNYYIECCHVSHSQDNEVIKNPFYTGKAPSLSPTTEEKDDKQQNEFICKLIEEIIKSKMNLSLIQDVIDNHLLEIKELLTANSHKPNRSYVEGFIDNYLALQVAVSEQSNISQASKILAKEVLLAVSDVVRLANENIKELADILRYTAALLKNSGSHGARNQLLLYAEKIKESRNGSVLVAVLLAFVSLALIVGCNVLVIASMGLAGIVLCMIVSAFGLIPLACGVKDMVHARRNHGLFESVKNICDQHVSEGSDAKENSLTEAKLSGFRKD